MTLTIAAPRPPTIERDAALWAQHRADAAQRAARDDWRRWPECRPSDVHDAVTCISCGAAYGQPHASGCEFR